MKILKTVIASIVTICILVAMTLCFGACGNENEDNLQVETTEIATTVAPTTVAHTTVAPITVKPTQKVTEPVTKATKATEEVEADKNSEEKEEDINEDGSNSSADYVDDNDDVSSNSNSNNSVGSGAIYSAEEFQNAGVINWGGYQWTYYSELILPGDGLDIPGRHTTSDGYVCDGDGYVVLASDLSMLSRGSVVDTPFGYTGKVYDTGCAYGVLDVYVSW